MGVLFGLLFVRWRRTWPFVVSHFLLDAVAAGDGSSCTGRVPGT